MSEPSPALRMWLQKLQLPEPALREESIKAIAMLGDTIALGALADVFSTDPEPELRALAQWAGKSIYYGALRQKLDEPGASDEERRRAAEILAQARVKKSQTQELNKKK